MIRASFSIWSSDACRLLCWPPVADGEELEAEGELEPLPDCVLRDELDDGPDADEDDRLLLDEDDDDEDDEDEEDDEDDEEEDVLLLDDGDGNEDDEEEDELEGIEGMELCWVCMV